MRFPTIVEVKHSCGHVFSYNKERLTRLWTKEAGVPLDRELVADCPCPTCCEAASAYPNPRG